MTGKSQVVAAALAAQKKRKPSAGMSKKAKSAAVSEAQEGKDMGDTGKNFGSIAAKAANKYGSKAAGQKVAGAAFWQKMKKK